MKRVLLIAGGGTLGSYTALELLRLGYAVDVIALEELRSLLPNLTYIRERVSAELLERLTAGTRYDAVVDFLHDRDPENFRARFDLLGDRVGQYLFLSSYRVYADGTLPLCEDAPQLLDVYGETGLLAEDTYGISKSKSERILRASGRRNWTILRPLISFSHFRFDLVTLGGFHLIPRAAARKKVVLPQEAREKTAGVGWAGNAGRLIARLVGNPGAFCEDFLIGNDENLTWGQIADIYTEVTGLSFVWVETEEYLRAATECRPSDRIILYHDRLYDRRVDNSKVRTVTGMRREEFVGFRPALIYELTQLSAQPALLRNFTESEKAACVNRRMDDWLAAHGEG